jgi:ATP-dependent Clp protease ATP-binding subunit ClpA
MTTNAGARDSARRSMGFTEQDHSSDSLEVIKKAFSPEFRNRLDAVIQFKPLGMTVVLLVVDKFILELEAQLAQKDVELSVSTAAREWLAKAGFDPQMGARPMKRVIQEQIKRPLADDLLFGKLANGGEVTVSDEGDGLQISTRPKAQGQKALPASAP